MSVNAIPKRKTTALARPLDRKRTFWANMKRDKFLYLVILPSVVYYLIFLYKPMWALQIAFKDYTPYRGVMGSPWIGFEHFISFFTGPYFWRTLRNTLVINLYSLAFGFPAPIILALMLNEVRSNKFRRTIQTITYMPHFISAVVVVGIVTNFLSPTTGIINVIIEKLGGEKTYFLTKPEYFRGIYTIMGIWKEVGFNSIVYIAALSGIDVQLYEACTIDGGGRWARIWHVTLPGILPTVVIMLIMKVGSLLECGYETIILLYQPATYETADVISSYVYRVGLTDGRHSFATAVGLFNSVVALILVVGANYVSRRVTETSLW